MNQTLPVIPGLFAKTILSSGHANVGPNLYTLHLRYPRIIHAEVMTHRMFSRNARSSRAVPVKTMLQEIRDAPFVPWHWGKNQSGMQAGEECTASIADWRSPGADLDRVNAWCQAATQAISAAEGFMNAGYHKQIVNRLLEPFMWIDTLITSSQWENFLWLRDHEAAEPHLRDLARLVAAEIEQPVIQILKDDHWHLPYITENDRYYAFFNMGFGRNTPAYYEWLCKISAARCARISYKPFDGDATYSRELERYDGLVSSDRIHASPLEHQATPDTATYHYLNDTSVWNNAHLQGNLTGWVQYRKMVAGENHTT